jgi:predicted MFS family arabinose efflux permease
MVLEASLFTVLAPLLAGYSDEFHLSKAGAGILAASYGAGVLAGALPGGALASRIGCRATILVALALMAVTSAGFGVAPTAELLVGTRFGQGFAGGMLWSAGLTWVTLLAPPDRRGEALGGLVGIALAGSLVGPPLGALADATSAEAVFLSIPVVCAALAAVVLRVPADRGPEGESRLLTLLSARGRDRVAAACWLVMAGASVSGLVLTIGPLRLSDLGAGTGVVGGIFLAAAAGQAAVTPLIGRLVDRHGAGALLLPGLAGVGLAVLLVVPPQSTPLLAAVLVGLTAAGGLFVVPGAMLLRQHAGAAGLSDGQSMGVFNIAWATGQTAGAAGCGAVAQLTSDFVPCLLGSAAFFATFALLRTRRGRRLVAA